MSIEKKKKQLELARVSLAKQDMELKIEEKMEEVKRLQDAIKIQEQKEAELQLEINKL